MRAKNDVFAQLQPNQVLLTNLPEKFNNSSELKSIPEFLYKNVHKDLDINDVEIIPTLGTKNLREKTAYIKVTLGNKR